MKTYCTNVVHTQIKIQSLHPIAKDSPLIDEAWFSIQQHSPANNQSLHPIAKDPPLMKLDEVSSNAEVFQT